MGRLVADIEVVPATLERWSQLNALFATSPGVDGCWCMWPLRAPMTHRSDRDLNKAEMESLVARGETPGLLALAKQQAVGWCAVGPRHRYPQYGNDREERRAWAIPCIYIEPAANRTAVARALIGAAVESAEAHGAVAIEGPPAWWLPGDAAAIARATTDFLDNGFVQVGAGGRMPELRRELARRELP